MLADAIRDEDLRGLLSEAERRLNIGDFRTAFRYADQALPQARVQWRGQRDGEYGLLTATVILAGSPACPRPASQSSSLKCS